MPIYEYRCEDCGAIVEVLNHRLGDEALCCSICAGSNLTRILSAASIRTQGDSRQPGKTCCGRDERCEKPPCSSTGGRCRRPSHPL